MEKSVRTVYAQHESEKIIEKCEPLNKTTILQRIK